MDFTKLHKFSKIMTFSEFMDFMQFLRQRCHRAISLYRRNDLGSFWGAGFVKIMKMTNFLDFPEISLKL